MKIEKILSFLLIISFSLTVFGCRKPAPDNGRNLVTIKYQNNYDSGIAEVYWDSMLFEKGPGEFNLDLARTSAALCAASNDRSKRLGCADYIVDALHDSLGLEDIWLHSYNNYKGKAATVDNDGADWDLSTAFSIGHQRMTASDGHEFEVVVVVCRGTEGWQDAVFFDFLGTAFFSETEWFGFETYMGYSIFAEEIRNALIDYTNMYGGSFAKEVKFLFTGHSLGGTPVQLIAGSLQDYDVCAYAYTFGSLNATQKPYTGYDIWNVFNIYDDYGPEGDQFFKPSGGDYTYKNKIGNVLTFGYDFGKIFLCNDGYYNHVMAGYYEAMRDGMLDENGNETQ